MNLICRSRSTLSLSLFLHFFFSRQNALLSPAEQPWKAGYGVLHCAVHCVRCIDTIRCIGARMYPFSPRCLRQQSNFQVVRTKCTRRGYNSYVLMCVCFFFLNLSGYPVVWLARRWWNHTAFVMDCIHSNIMYRFSPFAFLSFYILRRRSIPFSSVYVCCAFHFTFCCIPCSSLAFSICNFFGECTFSSSIMYYCMKNSRPSRTSHMSLVYAQRENCLPDKKKKTYHNQQLAGVLAQF